MCPGSQEGKPHPWVQLTHYELPVKRGIIINFVCVCVKVCFYHSMEISVPSYFYNVSFVFCVKTGTQPFNRAMLFNVGFKEAMKDAVWDCIIFHDVDHLPENDRNYYGCGEMPRHFAAKLDKYMYM